MTRQPGPGPRRDGLQARACPCGTTRRAVETPFSSGGNRSIGTQRACLHPLLSVAAAGPPGPICLVADLPLHSSGEAVVTVVSVTEMTTEPTVLV